MACTELDGLTGGSDAPDGSLDARLDSITAPDVADGPSPSTPDSGGDLDAAAAVGELRLALGFQHACAYRVGGNAKCWGRNDEGELGLGHTAERGGQAYQMGAALPVIALGAPVREMAAGNAHTCALLESGVVKCWGLNNYGQLGLDHGLSRATPTEIVRLGRRAVAIRAGGHFSCALLEDRTVKCWGENHHGELGLGDTFPRGDDAGEISSLPAVGLGERVTALATGQHHVCGVIGGENVVRCWGYNHVGQLGVGDVNDRGDQPDELGVALRDACFRGRAGDIGAGHAHVCAIDSVGATQCWGYNQHGSLGLGDQLPRCADGGATAMVGRPYLGLHRTARSIAVGFVHTCALLDDSTMKCWGNNDVGQLGLGDDRSRGAVAGQMGENLPAITIGNGPIKRIAAGWYFTCAVDDTGVKCWGENVKGQLGLGDHAPRGNTTTTLPKNLPYIDLAF